MNSAGYEQQMANVRSQLDPMLTDMPKANDYFKKGLNEAYGYNAPLLKEGANLEAGAYSLPGKLMNQYNQEFGNVFGGASASGRLNSILGRLGNQFSLADVASGLADRQGARINDLAKSLSEQYGLGIQGLQTKYDMLSPLFQAKLNAEQQAANRRASSSSGGLNFKKFLENLYGDGSNTTTPTTQTNTQLNSPVAKLFQKYTKNPTPITYSKGPRTATSPVLSSSTDLFRSYTQPSINNLR